MNIDTKTYELEPKNYYKSICAKKQIVLCGSLRNDNYGIIHLQHKDYGKSKKWNAFTISREGIVYQHYNPKFYSDFLGVKEIDKQAISVVLENSGGLFKILNNEYVNWINESCPVENVYKQSWSNYGYWEKYSDKQFIAVLELCKRLCEEFNIRLKIIEFNLYHRETIKFNGVVSRSNYFESATDINPSFDFIDFQKKLTREEENKIND